MKNSCILVMFFVLAMNAFSQRAINADGTLKFRGNVAIMVEGSSFTFKEGKFVKQVDDEITQSLETSLRALSMEKFQDMCFAVVNRDDEAFNKVKQLIEENKLEDYLDGFSVQAKNQGADYLFLLEITNYSEDDEVGQIEVSTRLINIENNFGFHSFYRSNAIVLKDENEMRKESRKIIDDVSLYLERQLLEVFPEQYFIAKSDGKSWSLGAYQPNGAIKPSDKFYAFKFQKSNIQLNQKILPIQVLDEIAVADNPKVGNGGYLQVKANKSLENTSNIVLFRNLSEPVFAGTNQMLITFFGFNYDKTSYDGLIKNRINNSVFSAITRHAGTQLIEHDHLSEIRKERELQKSEEFINGHVVEQMKAIGAQYLIHIENYQRNGTQVSFTLSFISIEANRIIRSVEVKTSMDNIENEMYKQLCERIANPCIVKLIDKNTIEMTSLLSLSSGDDCVLELTKAIQNPITGEVSYSVSDLCLLTFKQYHGNKSIMLITDVFNKEDIKNLEQHSTNGALTFRINGSKIKSNDDMQNEVQKKAKKVEKNKTFSKAIKEAGRRMIKSTKINSSQRSYRF